MSADLAADFASDPAAALDLRFMGEALRLAQQAADEGEVPVGALVVAEGRVLARAHNQTERLTDATAHAEMLALTAAMGELRSKYLPDCTLYVTLEPCTMCAGALRWAQIGRVVYGASDEKFGYTRAGLSLHPKTQVSAGLRAHDCAELLRAFFRARR